MENSVQLNRRQFVYSTAAACVAAVLPVNSAATVVSSTTPRRKFCAFEKPLQSFSYEDTAAFLADAGFDGVEATVRPAGHVLPERVEEDLPRFHEALARKGLEVTVLTSGINRVDSPHARKVLQTAAKLGIKRYRLLWCEYDLNKPILPQLDAFRASLEELAALNHALGLTGVYQNHAGEKMFGAALWDIYDAIKELNPEHLALAYDIRHAIVEGGLSWPTQFHLVKSHIDTVYVKDFVWQAMKVKNVPLGDGTVDRRFFKLLRQTGFAGPISLHVEYLDKTADRKQLAEAFRKDFATLKGWLAES